MKIRKDFFPKRLVEIYSLFLILFFLPVVLVFDIIIVLPAFHEPYGVIYVWSYMLAIFVTFNIVGNLIAVMLVDTSVDHKILTPPNDAIEKHGWWHCASCDHLSPPRSWHCKYCRTCILKRDHHCVFTGCCIGHENHRYFFLFVFYMFVGTFYVFIYNSIYFWVLRRSYYWTWISLLKIVCPMALFIDGQIWDNAYLLFYLLNIVTLGYSFTVMTCQAVLIWCGEVSYERGKSHINYKDGWRSNLRNVFGKRMQMVWLSPFLKSELPFDGVKWKQSQPKKAIEHVAKTEEIH